MTLATFRRGATRSARCGCTPLAAGGTPVQPWAIGQALLVGLRIERRLPPGLVTPEVFERAFGLLAGLYQVQ
jgi:hypothetical protein